MTPAQTYAGVAAFTVLAMFALLALKSWSAPAGAFSPLAAVAMLFAFAGLFLNEYPLQGYLAMGTGGILALIDLLRPGKQE